MSDDCCGGWRGWVWRLTSWCLLGLACAYFLIVALMSWKGGAWAYIVYAERPFAHLFGGLLCLLGWYYFRRGHRNDRHAWKQFFGRVVLVACSTLFAWALAEVSLRLFLIQQQRAQSLTRFQKMLRNGEQVPLRSTHPLAYIVQPSENRALVYELRPNLEMEFGHRRVKTNADGMRDSRDYPLKRSAESVRIIGVGDSGMFGWDVEQDQDYLAVLEERLNSSSEGVYYEVLNMAVPGYNTQLEVEMARSKGLKYQPDVVIVGWCGNDSELPYFLLEEGRYMRMDMSFLNALLFDRERLKRIITSEKITDQRKHNMEAVSPKLKDGAGLDGVRENLQQLKQMAQEHRFDVLVFGPMSNDVLTLCREIEVPYFNTLAEIPAGRYPEEWAIHFMHPRAEGHRVLAEHLQAELARRGWLKPRPVPQRSQSSSFHAPAVAWIAERARDGPVSGNGALP